MLFLCYDYQNFKVVTEISKSAFSGTMISEYLWRVLNQLAAYNKIIFSLSEPRDKAGRPSDVIATHMAGKNNVSE